MESSLKSSAKSDADDVVYSYESSVDYRTRLRQGQPNLHMHGWFIMAGASGGCGVRSSGLLPVGPVIRAVHKAVPMGWVQQLQFLGRLISKLWDYHKPHRRHPGGGKWF
ncbi:hypothetical protein RRG08_056433 [Elysia crispata]|uniref:Uncharacterized protein n=1 Tax=Elysia crispata TaxID=231223 RepID=A0AAE0XU98_9GAST|nr:hypothetical protein RRG08_056433 [Elysia crispata]